MPDMDRLRRIYSGMKTRCTNPNVKDYHRYGGRGIKVCDEWTNSSKSFFQWALSNGYDDNLSIERINVDGDYEPSNCCWITMKEQAINKQNTRWITIKGKTRTLSQWARISGLGKNVILGRIKSGVDNDSLLDPPLKPEQVEAFGMSKTISEWSHISGIGKFCLRNRIFTLGWLPEDAIMVPSLKRGPVNTNVRNV